MWNRFKHSKPFRKRFQLSDGQPKCYKTNVLVVTWLWSGVLRSSDTGSPFPFHGWWDFRWRWIGLCLACNRISIDFRDVGTKCIRSQSCWRRSKASIHGPVTSSFVVGSQSPPKDRASHDSILCIPQPLTPFPDVICIFLLALRWWSVVCKIWGTSWPRSLDFADKSCTCLTWWKFLSGLNFRPESLCRLAVLD